MSPLRLLEKPSTFALVESSPQLIVGTLEEELSISSKIFRMFEEHDSSLCYSVE